MRDESDLRRLAEMGIDVYRPRAVGMPASVAHASGARAMSEPRKSGAQPIAGTTTSQVDVLLLAEVTSPNARTLLADLSRAFGLSGLSCAELVGSADARLDVARALVAFGDGQLRAIGASVPTRRHQEMCWVAAADLVDLAGNAPGKRALWSELKRIMRELSRTQAATSAVAAAAVDDRPVMDGPKSAHRNP